MTAQTLTKEVKLCQKNDFSELCLCLAQIHSVDYDGATAGILMTMVTIDNDGLQNWVEVRSKTPRQTFCKITLQLFPLNIYC